MQPLILKMSAFGPYAQETVLDFTLLGDQRIFVVTGPTGAGKTTIFDGICYALYGETSGKERNAKGLRSDFVKDEDRIVTRVEFTFRVRGKDYRISRQPAQRLPSKRGDGWKEGGHEAEITCLGHEEFTPLTRVNEVDTKIVEILGLTADQFKKIVMIPQGDFRQFLNAGTSEKQGILRKLFGTDFFEQVQKALNNAARELEAQHKAGQQSLQDNIKHIDCGEDPLLTEQVANQADVADIVASLKAAIAYDQQAQVQYRRDYEQIQARQQAVQQALSDGQMRNDRLLRYGQAQQTLEQLLAQQEIYAKQKQQEEQIMLAQQLEPLAQQVAQAQQNLRRQTQQVAALNKDQQTKAEACREAELQLSALKAQSEQQIARQKQLTLLEGYRGDVEQLAEVSGKAKASRLQLEVLAQETRALHEQQAAHKVEHQQLGQQLAESEKQEVALVRAEQQIKTEEEERKALRKLISNLKQYRSGLESLAESRQVSGRKEATFNALTRQLKVQRAEQLAHYSISLADQLQPGQPCPVCGSCEHPTPGQQQGQIVDEQVIEQLERDAEAARLAWQTALGQVANWQGQLEKAGQQLQEQSAETVSALSAQQLADWETTVLEAGVALKKSIEAGQKTAQVCRDALSRREILQAGLAQRERLMAEHEQNLTKLQDKQLRLSQEEAAAGAARDAICQRVPEDYRTLPELEKGCRNLTKVLAKFQAELEQGQHHYDRLSSELQSLQGQLLGVETATEEARVLAKQSEQQWRQAIREAFATETLYEASRLALPQLAALRQEISTYQSQLLAAQSVLSQFEKTLADQKPVDIAALQQVQRELAEALTANVTRQNQLASRQQYNSRLLADICRQMAEMAEIAQQYATARKLDKLANGDNDWRMSFETFVLITYFLQVLERANLRLAKMTGGRYYFLRRLEAGDKRKSAGLEIDIMDNYTGKARSVSSLSGGEGFKASLALALGLSDVVQSSVGGIELNTIFIDEGFGTLDADSLDTTIDCLVELQAHGRLVGIISHVAELKERINAQLVVEGGERGSTARFECH